MGDLDTKLRAAMAEADEWGTVADFERSLAEQGLHVVTAEQWQTLVQRATSDTDKAVLTACADLAWSTCHAYQNSGPFRHVAQAELDRRHEPSFHGDGPVD